MSALTPEARAGRRWTGAQSYATPSTFWAARGRTLSSSTWRTATSWAASRSLSTNPTARQCGSTWRSGGRLRRSPPPRCPPPPPAGSGTATAAQRYPPPFISLTKRCTGTAQHSPPSAVCPTHVLPRAGNSLPRRPHQPRRHRPTSHNLPFPQINHTVIFWVIAKYYKGDTQERLFAGSLSCIKLTDAHRIIPPSNTKPFPVDIRWQVPHST